MRRSLIALSIVTLAIFSLCSVLIAREAPYLLVRVDINPEVKVVPLLELGLDIADGIKGQYLDVVCHPEDLQRIRALGYQAEILISDMETYYAERSGTDDMGGFRTYSEVVTDLNQIHNNYPNITTAPFSIGQSIENRDLWVIKVSDNPEIEEDEPEVFFNGLIHAREGIGISIIFELLNQLTSRYGIDPEITEMVDGREIYFLPVFNPDGWVYNEQQSPGGGGMWRKNRRNNGGSYGVDLNRNWGFEWGRNNIGSSGSPSSETYRGTAPFSEPETEAVRQFCNQHTFAIIQNFHSYSNLELYPWSNPPPEYGYCPDDATFQMLSQIMQQWTGYIYGPPWEILYEVNGDANDWQYGEQVEKPKSYPWVFEVGESFWPSISVQPGLVAENIEPAFFMIQQAENYMPTPVNLAYLSGIIDDAGGNNNGGLDPGESVLFTPTLRNNGWIAGTGISATLICGDPYITITTNSSTFPNLDPHASAASNTPYTMSVSSSCPLEHTVNFGLIWTCNEGFTDTATFNLIVGDPLYQPMGPDAYGYMAYDNYDEGGPEFNWIEIDPTYGGPGTLLNFTQDDQTFTVSLPFSFQYYGQSYNEISVCGNGWIAMGTTTETDYSNSPIPDSDGPPAMIAPFWEDLSPQQLGQIAYYYDATNHYFVVEFDSVRQYLPTTALETFEVILYDPVHYPTLTGDGQILFQYNQISDASANTIGIENHLETVGLQLLYDGDLDSHVPYPEPGVAVLFTTSTSIPDVVVELNYVSGSPVPAGGGNLNFGLYVENIGSTPLNFDGWIDISYEGGPPTTVVLRSFTNFQPGWTINRPDMYFPVPGTYPAGNYTLTGRVGTHPDDIWDESGFPFTKLGDDGVAGFIPWIPDGMPDPFDQIITGEPEGASPAEFAVSRAYPNPFNPKTALSYKLQASSFVTLTVYDISGRKVAELVNGWRDMGQHEVTFDGSNLASGVYIYRLELSGSGTTPTTMSGKMVLMK